MKNFQKFLDKFTEILPQIKALAELGATAFLVGGSTRDLLLDLPLTDFDIEVHGIELQNLQKLLNKFGQVCAAGKKFMVLKSPQNGIDWSIPRIDGQGRKPQVNFDKNLDLAVASRRRDLTINAISLNLNHLTQNLETIQKKALTTVNIENLLQFEDFLGGIADLRAKRLKAVDPAFFVQDPLRFFRVMQFHARFQFTPDEELNQLCATMAINTTDATNQNYVAAERITQELTKMLLKSQRPSLGFHWLVTVGRLKEFFPELAPSVGLQKSFLPEGKDLFAHLLQTLDAAAQIKVEPDAFPGYDNEQEKLAVQFAALLHDSGQGLNDEFGSDPIHDVKSENIAEQMLLRLKISHDLIAKVKKIILWHEKPEKMLQNCPAVEFKILAKELAPHSNLRQLGLMALSDKQGVPLELDLSHWQEDYHNFIAKANQAGVLLSPEPALLSGNDLTTYLKPGPQLGQILARAYDLQLQYGISDKQQLIKLALQDDGFGF